MGSDAAGEELGHEEPCERLGAPLRYPAGPELEAQHVRRRCVSIPTHACCAYSTTIIISAFGVDGRKFKSDTATIDFHILTRVFLPTSKTSSMIFATACAS